MGFKIIRNDITKMQVDAIVNTANSKPCYNRGLDFAIYKSAGEELLLAERKKIGYMNEGQVAITPAFNLPSKYIIHAVSPLYEQNVDKESVLRQCYRNCLELAYKNQCKSIAFPLISTGSYGYPKKEGLRLALDEINTFLISNEMDIYLVVYDDKATDLVKKIYSDLEEYIDCNYVCYEESKQENLRQFNPVSKKSSHIDEEMMTLMSPSADLFYDEDLWEKNESALKERMEHLSDTFQEYLFYLINKKRLSNSQVYKDAIVTKQLFSKIKLNKNYHPDKVTAMCLCIGAHLNINETEQLLRRAGYALSPCDKRDIIFSYFIENEIYDMIELDIALEEYDLPCFIK